MDSNTAQNTTPTQSKTNEHEEHSQPSMKDTQLEEKLAKSFSNQTEHRVEDDISVNSTSSSDSEKNEQRMNQALSFLNNPTISDVSYKEKERYLLNKGYSLKDIQRATDRKAKRKSRHHHDFQEQHRNYNSPSSHINSSRIVTEHEEKMSGAMVTTAMGAGALIAIVAMASWRWLNGGDFELIPPPSNNAMRAIDTASSQDSVNDENDSETSSNEEELEATNQQEQQVSESNTIIITKLDELNDNIHKLNTNFEKFLQTQTAQQHRTLTNSTIDLLRQSSSTTDKKGTQSLKNTNCPSNKQKVFEIIQSIKNNKILTSKSSFQDSMRMLYLYLNNLKQNTKVSRYRKIYTQSDTFQKIVPLYENGILELLELVGFKKDNNWLEIGDDVEVDLDLLDGILSDLSALMNSKVDDNTVDDSNGASGKTVSEHPTPTSE